MSGSLAILAVLIIMFFIFPAAAEKELEKDKLVKASEILERIRREEPVEYSNVWIEGDIHLNGTDLAAPRIINSTINIVDSKIDGVIDLNDSKMLKSVRFERSYFLKPANFEQTRFLEGASFSQSQFTYAVSFKGATISKNANFNKVQFDGTADFWRCTISADAANFEGALFKGPAHFWGTKFESDDTNFEWSQFSSFASFWGASFGQEANFRGAKFEDEADLTLAQFSGTADFLGVSFGKKLYFNDVKFGAFKVQWTSIGNRLVCNGPPYLQLIKNFKEQEQFEDADSCYYDYRTWKRNNRSLGWPKLFDYMAWISCGYGVRWTHPILSGLLVVTLFGAYFQSCSLIKCRGSYLSQGRGEALVNLKHEMKQSMLFSAMTLLSLPSEWSPFGRDEYISMLRSHLCAAALERMIGWGLMLLLIGTLTRLIVRY